MIIDIHAHAFPDSIAEKAITTLEEKSFGIDAHTDGTISGLLKSMDSAGIEKSVIQSIATKPDQVEKITDWSIKIKKERIIPFCSIHPQYENYKEEIKRISNENIRGIKLHPMYQNFNIDDQNMQNIYEEAAKNNIIILFHSGNDIAFPEDNRGDINKFLKVRQEFPELKIILAHFGGWQSWQDVLDYIAGKDFYIDTSFAINMGFNNIIKDIISKHQPEKILFGTDSPWRDQKKEVERTRNFIAEFNILEKVFSENTIKLLNI